MKRTLYLIITLLLTASVVKGQPDCHFTHYSSENGLSQNTVMCILQDRKGNMWFSTWNGINKFNGYGFKTYKAKQDNEVSLTNNRVDWMQEDKYGFIWMRTYDNQAYRFNPHIERFECVPDAGEKGSATYVSFIRLLPGGTTWLLTEKGDAICVTTNPDNLQLAATNYSGGSGYLPDGAALKDVFEDQNGRIWLLTDNGLGMTSCPVDEKPAFYFVETDRKDHSKVQPFFTASEVGEEIFFGSNNGRVWRYHSNGQFQLLQLPASSSVVDIQQLEAGNLLFVTSTDGFFTYDLQTGKHVHYSSSLLPDAPVQSAYVDSGKEVWFNQSVPGTVAHFNPRTRRVKTEVVSVDWANADPARPAFHVHEDTYGTVWIHPYGGGFSRYDRENECLRPFYNSQIPGQEWRFSNKIHCAFSDRQGNLWMCTHSKGLEKVTFRHKQFQLMTPVPQRKESLCNEVRALCEDRDGDLWVGLKDGKLRVYDKNLHERGYLTENGAVSQTGQPLAGNVYYILQDSRNNLWIATKGKGLVKAEPQGGHRYRLTRYQYNEEDIYSLSDDNVYCVYEDSRGRIWIATFAGGVNYLSTDAEGKEIFVNHRNNLKHYPMDACSKARFITGDGQGNVWIGTTVGALMVKEDFELPEEARFHHYQRVPEDGNSLSNNDVHWIIATSSKELYLATFGGGLNRLTSLDENGNATFESYTVQDGLPSDILLSIREDASGNLWMSTENGVSKFVPSNSTFENYSDKSISFRVRFSEAASAYTSQGNMLFGASNGIFSFHPDSIRKSRYVPPIIFSRLLVANEYITPGSSPILQQILDDTSCLTLSHRENIFTIHYAALDYTEPSETQYAYLLEGFDKGWNYVGTQRTATYTNLPKGHYVFKVRSTNSDGVWTENTRSMGIHVLPSFWETPLAYFLYVFFLLLVMAIAVYILFTIYRLKHKVAMEQQMTDMKLRFFTDISHELRTPLTLIAGPVGYVLENTPLPEDAREQLKVVERNTNRMLRLINQILDFRKIQNKKMKMKVQCIDIVAFTRKIMQNFDSIAEEHHIDYLFETEKEELCLWVDADKYEKIIFNLLSNAFKYTPGGKMIQVFIREDEKTVSIGVQDQGIGIDENKRKSIFLRFENLVDHNLFNQSSTGIGLSLVKELVEMHKAIISVESKLGEGSCFKVDFQKGKRHYDDTVEYLQDDSKVEIAKQVLDAETAVGGNAVIPSETVANTSEAESAKGIMLIVEDNTELRIFLRSIFYSDFNVVEAADGKQALEKALSLLPDIIISDVMMPEMDGITLTRELRADMTTSHIPIVLLTAKTAIESKLEGLEYGADDYITKPFSATYLKARVKNLLVQRKQLQAFYRVDLMPATTVSLETTPANPQQEAAEVPSSDASSLAVPSEEKQPLELSSNDRKFMDKLIELMEKNMDNGELVVDDLVRELAVSRSVFFKKLKTLTGLAPVEFIKEMRINRAIQLIETDEYSMTQIAYMVGINDPRYFSKCFKQKMGMTPTEYKEKKKAAASSSK